MRKSVFLLLVVIITGKINAQNVGINISNPAYPLTVASNANGTGIVQTSGAIEINLITDASGAWLKSRSNTNLMFAVNQFTGTINPVMTVWTSGNIGIGTTSAPQYKVDLNGRMRIRHTATGNQTAGVWFDGVSQPVRSFTGTLNEDHVGLFGNGSAGWNFVMNVNNGNTGIGTSAPTAKLHIDGSVRLRANNPKTGSKLISTDNNGNISWQAPVAFRAYGSADGNNTIHNDPQGLLDWARYYFSTAPDYNLGLYYNGITSEFTAPYSGIYHFDAQMTFLNENYMADLAIEVVDANGTFVNNKYSRVSCGSVSGAPAAATTIYAAHVTTLSADLRLNAGERVFVKYGRSNGYRVPVYDVISANIKHTWFSGHLVARL